jgi:hypothetical protein
MPFCFPPQLSDFPQRLSSFPQRLSIFQEIRENLSTARSGETVRMYPFPPFDHSAILSAIPPFRPPFLHSAIPPFPPLFLLQLAEELVTPQPACLQHNDK